MARYNRAMSVRQLISLLQRFHPDLEVIIQSPNDSLYGVEEVKHYSSILVDYNAVVISFEGEIEPEEEG